MIRERAPSFNNNPPIHIGNEAKVVPFETKIEPKKDVNKIYIKNAKFMAENAGIEGLSQDVFELYAEKREKNSDKMGDLQLFAKMLEDQGKKDELIKLKAFYKENFV